MQIVVCNPHVQVLRLRCLRSSAQNDNEAQRCHPEQSMPQACGAKDLYEMIMNHIPNNRLIVTIQSSMSLSYDASLFVILMYRSCASQAYGTLRSG